MGATVQSSSPDLPESPVSLDLNAVAESLAIAFRRMQAVVVLPGEKRPRDKTGKVFLTPLEGFTFETKVGDFTFCATVESDGTTYVSVGGIGRSDERSVVLGHIRKFDAREARRVAEQLLAHDVMRT